MRPRHIKIAKYCPHCDPYPPCHQNTFDKIAEFLEPCLWLPGRLEMILSRQDWYRKALRKGIDRLASLLLRFGVLREFELSVDDERIFNRTLVFIKPAEDRGLVMRGVSLGQRPILSLLRGNDGAEHFFDGLPTLDSGRGRIRDIDDKLAFKRILKRHGFPCAPGRAFVSERKVARYFRELGRPVAVKPKDGSLSMHTFGPVADEKRLRECFRLVRQVSRAVMVESWIEGRVWRVTVVAGRVAACCWREAPNVVGDGVRSVRELIEVKNSEPRRGGQRQKNATLHQIAVTYRTGVVLEEQGLTERSVPKDGQKVYLHEKVILACGADIHDATEAMHKDNRVLFESLSGLCGFQTVGFDAVCQDIGRSHREQEFAVLEANSLPFIDMHHEPTSGLPRDVAGAMLDAWLAEVK